MRLPCDHNPDLDWDGMLCARCRNTGWLPQRHPLGNGYRCMGRTGILRRRNCWHLASHIRTNQKNPARNGWYCERH